MAGLRSLVNLVKVLTPEEVETVSKYLHSFHRWGVKHTGTKLIVLYEVLVKNIDNPLNENEVIFLVYGESKVQAFDKLVIRLRDKVLESLLLDINIHREGNYGERARALFDVRKRISCGQIMATRGRSDIAIYLFQYAIDDSKKYEFYDELLASQKLLIAVLGITKGVKEYKRQAELFQTYSYCRQAAEKAQFAYYDYCVCDAFKAEGETAVVRLQKITRDLNKDYSITQSATVKFYQYYLQAYLFERLKDLKKLRKTMLGLVDLLEKNPAIYSQQRKSLSLVNLADCEIRLRKFDSAFALAKKAELLQVNDNFNKAQCVELQIWSLFYSGKFDEAENIADQLIKQYPAVESGEFHVGRRLYMKACALFMRKQFDEASTIVMELNPIESDAEGWNVGMRIMVILCQIELSLFDAASNSVKQLYEHLNRLKKEKELSKRTKTISEILSKLSKNGFQFLQTFTEIKDKLELLESDDEEMKWHPLTPEMIPFHQWLNSKLFHHTIKPFPVIIKNQQKETVS